MRKTILLLTGILVLIFSTSVYAQKTDNALATYTLKNGLKIIVKPDNRAPIAIIEVWYKVGSSYEPNGITGISHVLEHLMFDGSKNYPENTYAKIIAQNGGVENAATSYDYTYYFTKIAADRLPIVFRLEADRMQNLTISEQGFAKEIKVVQEERRLRLVNNPQAQTYERFMAAAYLSVPYHHPVIGWESDLQHMTLNNVRRWYQTWYAPNNATLVVVGDVVPEQVYQLAEKTFGQIPTRKVPKLKPHPPQPPLGTRTIDIKLPAKLPWLLMGYQAPSLKTLPTNKTWQAYALLVLDGILDGDDSARLSRDLVRGKEIASSIGSNYNPLQKYTSQYLFAGIPAKNHTIAQLKAALLAEIKKLQQKPISAQELKRIKTQVIASNIYARDSIYIQAMKLGQLASLDLPLSLADDLPNKIAKVTAAQVQAVAKKYLVAKRLTLAILQPLPLNLQQRKNQQTQTPASAIGSTNVH
ncbi:MAG: pitrilysin family protein [Pseudomonadota bacterium]